MPTPGESFRSNDARSGPPGRGGLIRVGGKVDLDALRRAIHEQGDGPEVVAAAQAQSDGDETVAAPEAEDDAPNRVEFELRRDLNKRLDKYLTDRITFMSRTQLQKLIDDGGVTVNGRQPKGSTKLRLGDKVEVFIPAPPAEATPAQDIPLDVLFEDESIIVLNKQADIIVHPARSHLSGTMINALAYHFRHRSGGALSKVGEEWARPGVVHRLDRNTTGAIVFAKTDEAHFKLARQFEVRTVDKRYVALVHGRVEPLVDVIDVPIGRNPWGGRGIRGNTGGGQGGWGKTGGAIYGGLGGLGAKGGGGRAGGRGGVSIVEVELKTGRTHQIRVHFSHRGWPLVGDDMYTGRSVEMPATEDQPAASFARQALHAAMLAFRHPISGEAMRFVAPLPGDIRRLLAGVRAKAGAEEPGDVPGSVLKLEELLR